MSDRNVNDMHRFEVTFAPNPWGLPICRPPLVIIDQDYTTDSLKEWYPKSDIEVERNW
jgi:hypothetical protein